MAYATKEQYLLVYDTSASNARLEAYLGRASRKIDAALASHGVSVPADPSTVAGLADALADVCIDMVHRVMGDAACPEMPAGITSYSQTQGSFTESFAWAQPYTDIMIRDAELAWLLELLGADSSGVGSYRFGGAS